jgi:catalase (peroxidase I)
MIIVRNTFQLKFGHAKEVKALIAEGKELMKQHGQPEARYLMDVTGKFYILEMELTFENLAAYEKNSSETMSSKEFGAWYGKFMAHIESGHREIFSVID